MRALQTFLGHQHSKTRSYKKAPGSVAAAGGFEFGLSRDQLAACAWSWPEHGLTCARRLLKMNDCANPAEHPGSALTGIESNFCKTRETLI